MSNETSCVICSPCLALSCLLAGCRVHMLHGTPQTSCNKGQKVQASKPGNLEACRPSSIQASMLQGLQASRPPSLQAPKLPSLQASKPPSLEASKPATFLSTDIHEYMHTWYHHANFVDRPIAAQALYIYASVATARTIHHPKTQDNRSFKNLVILGLEVC